MTAGAGGAQTAARLRLASKSERGSGAAQPAH
jgi:hypothetical protein